GAGVAAALTVALVATLGAVVLGFASRYMRGDARYGTFSRRLTLMVAATLVMGGTDSIVLFALSWCAASLLVAALIGHDAKLERRTRSAASALRWFAAGDALLLAAAAGVVTLTGSTEFAAANAALATSALPPAVLTTLALALTAAIVIRSALAPAHRWLMSSVNAPTPVSALLHAGFVNAGAIACLKFAGVFAQAPIALLALLLAGAVSIVAGLLVMRARFDAKGRLAGSTVAQMGFMLMQCGLGAYGHALFHLLVHGLFKGHGFLRAGSAVSARPEAALPRGEWLLIAPTVTFFVLFALTPLPIADVLLLCMFAVMVGELGLVARMAGSVRLGALGLLATLVPGAVLAFVVPAWIDASLGLSLPFAPAVSAHVVGTLIAVISALAFVGTAGIGGVPAVRAAVLRLAFPGSPRRRQASGRLASVIGTPRVLEGEQA
ncbi:MAG: proton-conducting transporter transmembrane domain-containing protein, partial [Gammaproteobacteria bacterium]